MLNMVAHNLSFMLILASRCATATVIMCTIGADQSARSIVITMRWSKNFNGAHDGAKEIIKSFNSSRKKDMYFHRFDFAIH
jgi:hypothetical protein